MLILDWVGLEEGIDNDGGFKIWKVMELIANWQLSQDSEDTVISKYQGQQPEPRQRVSDRPRACSARPERK